MSRLLLFALLIYIVLADESCSIQDKKESPDIRVIELDDSSKESGQSESEEQIVALHISQLDRRRREAIEAVSQKKNNFCENDDECDSGSVCLAHLTCVKGKWRTERVGSLKANATN